MTYDIIIKHIVELQSVDRPVRTVILADTIGYSVSGLLYHLRKMEKMQMVRRVGQRRGWLVT